VGAQPLRRTANVPCLGVQQECHHLEIILDALLGIRADVKGQRLDNRTRKIPLLHPRCRFNNMGPNWHHNHRSYPQSARCWGSVSNLMEHVGAVDGVESIFKVQRANYQVRSSVWISGKAVLSMGKALSFPAGESHTDLEGLQVLAKDCQDSGKRSFEHQASSSGVHSNGPQTAMRLDNGE
jgi:hypothetical protein